MNASCEFIANPNSTHKLGLVAKNRIDRASGVISEYFGVKSESVIYTSGSTEANNLVIKGVVGGRDNVKVIVSSLEHSSIVAPLNYLSSKGVDVQVIPLNSDGKIDLDVLESAIDDNTVLVSVCAVDSELGIVQPIDKIASIVKRHARCMFHTDATQAIGKVNIDYSSVDFITFTPHKFFGLNGTGVLINRSNFKLVPLIHGGKSTTKFWSGTPALSNIAALECAFVLATRELDLNYKHVKMLNDMLREELSSFKCVHINSPIDAIPNILNISLVGINRDEVLKVLEEHDIYVSTLSACSMGKSISNSVFAIYKDSELASNTIRISLAYTTTKSEIEEFLRVFKKLVNK